MQYDMAELAEVIQETDERYQEAGELTHLVRLLSDAVGFHRRGVSDELTWTIVAQALATAESVRDKIQHLLDLLEARGKGLKNAVDMSRASCSCGRQNKFWEGYDAACGSHASWLEGFVGQQRKIVT